MRTQSADLRTALEDSLAYTLERKQFGVPVATFEAIREKLGEMYARIYSLEAMGYRTAAFVDTPWISPKFHMDQGFEVFDDSADAIPREAQRGGIDLKGTTVDIRFSGLDQTFPHVDTITLAFRVPQSLPETERSKLERAAALCPIRQSIDAETLVTTTFNYGAAQAA